MSEELNKIMAEKVMGWYQGVIKETNQFVYWQGRNPRSLRGNVDDWNPTENLNQAMECVEKMNVLFYLKREAGSYTCSIFYSQQTYAEIDQNPATAICKAIAKAIGEDI